jgi:hypothetical protein
MSKQKFGVGVLIATTRTDATGLLLPVPQSYRLGIMQDISSDFSFESKPLYGANQLPVDQGRGKAKMTFSAKTADIKIAALAALHFGITPSTGYKAAALDVAGTIPSTPFEITPVVPGTGTWLSDLGVRDTSGNDLTRVASAPATGQYSVAAGMYTFAAADTGTSVLISFEYSATGSGITVPLTNQLMGYAPSFQCMLFNDTKGSKLALKLTNCQSDKLSIPFKNEDFAIADFGFQALDDGTGSAGYWSQA